MTKYWDFTGNEKQGKNGVKLKEIRCTKEIIIKSISVGSSLLSTSCLENMSDSTIENELVWDIIIQPGTIGGFITSESNLAQDGSSWVNDGAVIEDDPDKEPSRIADNTIVNHGSYVCNSHINRSYLYQSIVCDSKIQTKRYTRLMFAILKETIANTHYLSLENMNVDRGAIFTSLSLNNMELYDCVLLFPTDIFYCIIPGIEGFWNREFRMYHSSNGITLFNYYDYDTEESKTKEYQMVCSPKSEEEFLEEVAKIYGNDFVNMYHRLILDAYNNMMKNWKETS